MRLVVMAIVLQLLCANLFAMGPYHRPFDSWSFWNNLRNERTQADDIDAAVRAHFDLDTKIGDATYLSETALSILCTWGTLDFQLITYTIRRGANPNTQIERLGQSETLFSFVLKTRTNIYEKARLLTLLVQEGLIPLIEDLECLYHLTDRLPVGSMERQDLLIALAPYVRSTLILSPNPAHAASFVTQP